MENSSDDSGELTLGTSYRPPFFKTKAIIVGEGSTGKTNIIERLVHNRFDPARVATIKYDISHTWIEIGAVTSSVIVDISIWDTAGQERFRTMASTFYRDCAICFIVYDITDRQSLEAAKWWYEECVRLSPPCITDFSPHNIALIGNKLDLDHLREVSYEEGQALGKTLGIPYFIEQSSIQRQECNSLDYLLSSMAGNTLKCLREKEKRKIFDSQMVSVPLDSESNRLTTKNLKQHMPNTIIKLGPKNSQRNDPDDSCSC